MVKAQNDKKEKVPVYNYVIDDPMDAFGRQPATEVMISPLLLPEFYSYLPRIDKDTEFKYECYNIHHDLLAIDSVHDFEAVRYISLFKNYPDRAHTYIDPTGNEKPLPISKIIYRYDKIGTDKWLSVNYANNKTINLVEFKAYVSKVDTSYSTTATGVTRKTVHKYYKVIPAKS